VIDFHGDIALYDPRNSKWMEADGTPLDPEDISAVRRHPAHKKMLDVLRTQLNKLHESKYFR
jgi:hypothetical protein